MQILIWWIAASAHVLAGAAWFGAMAYSLAVIQPRSKRFFADDDEKFELFVSTIAQGARWKVLGGLALIAASGLVLIPLSPPLVSAWTCVIAAKSALLLLAVILFCRISWRLMAASYFRAAKRIARDSAAISSFRDDHGSHRQLVYDAWFARWAAIAIAFGLAGGSGRQTRRGP
jgi:uncharacterized membrane protein